MGMSVLLSRATVGCPAGVTYSNGAGAGRIAEFTSEISKLSDCAPDVRFRIIQCRDSSAVVAAVLKTCESFKQNTLRCLMTNISHDSAHMHSCFLTELSAVSTRRSTVVHKWTCRREALYGPSDGRLCLFQCRTSRSDYLCHLLPALFNQAVIFDSSVLILNSGCVHGDGENPDTLDDYRSSAARMDASAFGDEHGLAFLLIYVSITGSRIDLDFESAPTSDMELRVLPVRKTPRCAFPFIAIGRTKNNDVVMKNPSVSKFHAMIKITPAGLMLQDAKSTNGTFIDGTAVPARGTGDPVALGARHALRIGHCDSQFFSASAFHSFLRR